MACSPRALERCAVSAELRQQPADTMTDRSELLIRNAYVLTMDAAGDLAGADVHVRDGAIAAVGRDLSAPGAQIIDGAGMLVLPGFVETHWHVWTSLLRSLAGDRAGARLLSDVAHDWHVLFRRRHVRRGKARRCRGHSFGHHVRARLVPQRSQPRATRKRRCARSRKPAFARASRTARRRARATTRASTCAISRGSAERWNDHANGGLLTLGLAWRGAASAATLRDYEVAKELGLPISVHANN